LTGGEVKFEATQQEAKLLLPGLTWGGYGSQDPTWSSGTHGKAK